MVINILYIVFLIPNFIKCETNNNYMLKRSQIIQQEDKMVLGGDLNLSDKEMVVCYCLMKYKYEEIDYGFNNPEYYNFSHHFFQYKHNIKDSEVYKIIKSLPKGAILHIHDIAMLGPDYLLNITYKDHLYGCFGEDLRLKFSITPPLDVPCDSRWELVSEARSESKNITIFDIELRKHFTLVVENPDSVYPTIKETWARFNEYFRTVGPMISFTPVWKQYLYDALKTFRDDNIMYVEMRTAFRLYDFDNPNDDDPLRSARVYERVITEFVKNHPDFIGAKMIYAPWRKLQGAALQEKIEMAQKLKTNFPDLMAGFDLVGQEDLGEPLLVNVPLLEAAKDLDFFFHAGETDWYGTSSDENMLDAVLLGAKRIGHGYALPKHPVIMRVVKELDIGVEVNVLSNAILSLVRDIRNHPLSVLLAHGMPVILSSDDPGAWEADALSDDFYAAFVGVASMHSDLRLLKTLALNSLKYSALDGTKKQSAIRDFHATWDKFVDNFNCDSY